jgi:signal transduction histidine kinase
VSFHFPLLIAPALVAGLLAFLLAGYVTRKQSPVFDTRGLITYLITSGISSILFVFVYLERDVSTMLLLLNLSWTSILVGLLGLFHFSLIFADRRDALTRPRVVTLVLASVAFITYIFTDSFHQTFRADVTVFTEPIRVVTVEYGPIGEATLYYPLALGLISMYFIIIHLFNSETYYRLPGLIIVAAMVLPIIGAVFNTTDWPHPTANLIPVFTVASGLLYTVAITRYEFLDVVPLAYQEIIESVDDIVIITSPTGTILDLDNQAQSVFGVENAIGEPMTEVLPIDPPLSDGGGETAGLTQWQTELTLAERSPHEQVFDVRAKPIHARDDRELGQAITLHEITELKQREKQLEQQNEQLDQFASMISHDLRNPLNVASIRTTLIAEETDSEHTEAVLESLDRMESMIDELLTLARMGQTIDSTEQCQLAAVAQQSWSNVQTDTSEVAVGFDDETIEADPARLRHIFENLFRNALEHNEHPLTVRLGPLEGESGFYVEDDGDGIPADERDSIFDHGYTTSESGTGFGLSIVEKIVEAHGWAITVTESVDGGARFEITTD